MFCRINLNINIGRVASHSAESGYFNIGIHISTSNDTVFVP